MRDKRGRGGREAQKKMDEKVSGGGRRVGGRGGRGEVVVKERRQMERGRKQDIAAC